MDNANFLKIRTLQYMRGYYDGVLNLSADTSMSTKDYLMGYQDGLADVALISRFSIEYNDIVNKAWEMFQKAQTVFL